MCSPVARPARRRSSSRVSKPTLEKLAIAREFGADATIDVQNEDPKHRIQELTDGRGADVVVDVSSYATEPVVQSLDYVRMGGTVVLAGVKGFKEVPGFISDKVVMKEVTIKGAIGVTSTGYANAIRLLESRKYPVERMHTHDFDLRRPTRRSAPSPGRSPATSRFTPA